MTYYNLRNNPPGDLPFTIIKFSSDLNPESTYSVGFTACSCPAGHRPKCRHREMLPKLRERVDTAWFWHFETQSWADPTGEAKAHDEVAEHDAATGGLEADQVSNEIPNRGLGNMNDISDAINSLCACGVEGCPNDKGDLCDMSSQRTDEGFLPNKVTKDPSPLGNEATSGFRRRI